MAPPCPSLSGLSPTGYWLDSGTAYSATNPLPGSTSSERWFAPGGEGSVSGSGSVVFAYEHQFYLTVIGGATASAWYDSGAQATVGQPVTYGRAAGTGKRVVSYSVDGGAQVPFAPAQGNVTVAVTMSAPHAVSFVSVTQYQVTLQTVAPQELDSITPPTIGGDSYWYDSGSVVSVALYGVWGRSAGEGQRLVSYSVNGGAQLQVGSKGTVEVLALGAISSPEAVTGTSTAQFFLTAATGALASITPPPISGDAGWYDNQTAVTATYDHSWNASAGQTRLNAFSYSIDGVQTSSISRKGSGTFPVSLTMDAPHRIDVRPVMQYLFTLSGGFDVTLSLQSPTGDGFYDSGSNMTVTSSYIGGVVPDKQRQALTGYTLDSKATDIARNETGTFTTPPIVFDTYHSLAFDSVGQYFVAFAFTDSSGSRQVVPTSLSIQQQNGGARSRPRLQHVGRQRDHLHDRKRDLGGRGRQASQPDPLPGQRAREHHGQVQDIPREHEGDRPLRARGPGRPGLRQARQRDDGDEDDELRRGGDFRPHPDRDVSGDGLVPRGLHLDLG